MFYLALRHLLSRRKQSFLTLMGILFGSMAFIAISGIMLGFRYYLIEKLVSSDAHIKITARETYLQERSLDKAFFLQSEKTHIFWAIPPSGRKDDNRIIDVQGWYRRVRNDPRVKAYSPILTSQALVQLASAQVSATLIGCDPEKQILTTNISNFVVQGSFQDLARGGNRIFLGSGLMRKLGARLGQTLNLSVGGVQSVPFKVIGVFRTGVMPVDDFRAYVELSDLQKLTDLRNVINEIGVTVHNIDVATSLATQWASLGQEKVQSWEQTNENLFSVFIIQDAIRYLMITVILIVASFGIYNILNMTVNQKKRDIAILRSMGYEAKDITFLFGVQGIILGIIGAFLGVIVGYLVSRYLETIPFSGGGMGEGDGHLMISYKGHIYISAFLLGAVSSVLASMIPARSAGRMEPIDIIRAGAE